MEWRRREDLRGEFKRVERGWCLGGEEFRQELLEQVDARPGPSHFGEAVQEAEAAQAERLGGGGRWVWGGGGVPPGAGGAGGRGRGPELLGGGGERGGGRESRAAGGGR